VSFLAGAQAQGHRLVLVITGKGRARESWPAPDERGVLRRLVPQWLALPELRVLVLGFEPAQRTHGGDGALYVRLRRTGRAR
jgi:DNA-nicking Smr family endonuclease